MNHNCSFLVEWYSLFPEFVIFSMYLTCLRTNAWFHANTVSDNYWNPNEVRLKQHVLKARHSPGKKLAPTCANIFMYCIVNTFISSFTLQLTVHFRYIDGISLSSHKVWILF